MINITDTQFEEEVLESDIPVIVDFWAPWCSPCNAITPHLESVEKEFDGQVKFVKVNVDENQRYAQEYGVRGIPALRVFKNRELIGQYTGLPHEVRKTLKELASKALY